MSVDKLAALMRKLRYEFDDIKLLKLALTHRSRGSKNYERLEFLGDSILGFVVAQWLYQEFPQLAEGKLSRMRSSLVRKETLAQVARTLDVGEYLILGEGELKSGGFNRDSILADVVESLIGGIFLDSDFQHASDFIFSHFATHFSAISAQSNFKDAKSQLQELMQKNGIALPVYSIVGIKGEQHEQEFTVECSLPDLPVKAVAIGGTRRNAEQDSASLVLDKLSDSAWIDLKPSSGTVKKSTKEAVKKGAKNGK